MKVEETPKLSSNLAPQKFIRAQAKLLELQLATLDNPLERTETLLLLAWELHSGNPQRALELTEEASRLSENEMNADIQFHHAMSLCLMGVCYRNLGDFGAAHAITDQALTLFESLGKISGQALALSNIGMVCARLGKFDEAERYLQKSLKIQQTVEDKSAISDILISLGMLYNDLAVADHQPSAHSTALNYLHSARDYAEQLDSKHLLATVSYALSETYKTMKNYQKALFYHEEYMKVWELVLHNDNELRVQIVNEQFELERKQQATEIYRLRTVELAEAQEESKLLIEALQQADLKQSKLLSELAEKNLQLEKLSKEDSLTGLFNRRHIDHILAQEFSIAKSSRSKLTIGILDLDNFKKINDTYSHQIGDEVLRVTSDLIKTRVGREGIAGRYGGEEFLIVFPKASLERAALVSDTIRRSVEVHDWSIIHPNLSVTLSMGLCCDISLASYEKMVAAADEKLYEAKKNGRNQVRY